VTLTEDTVRRGRRTAPTLGTPPLLIHTSEEISRTRTSGELLHTKTHSCSGCIFLDQPTTTATATCGKTPKLDVSEAMRNASNEI